MMYRLMSGEVCAGREVRKPRVIFTGLSSSVVRKLKQVRAVGQLSSVCLPFLLPSRCQILQSLGGTVTTDPKQSTHLVAPRVRRHTLTSITVFPSSPSQVARTVKFLSAISVCDHVVSPDWLESSMEEGKFVGELNQSLTPTPLPLLLLIS